MSLFTEIHAIIEEIKGMCEIDKDCERQFYNLLNEFRTNPVNSNKIYMKMLNLFSYNIDLQEKIRLAIEKFKVKPEEITTRVNSFINFVIENYKLDNLRYKINNIVSFLSEDLITVDIAEEWFLRNFPDIQLSLIQEQLHILSWDLQRSRAQFSHSLSSGFPILSLLPENFYSFRFRQIPSEIKFIVSATLLNNEPETQTSIYKLLKLFGSQVITPEIALNWMNEIDSFLSPYFEELMFTNEPLSLYPSNMIKLFQTYMADEQIQWAIGDHMNKLFLTTKKLMFVCPMAAGNDKSLKNQQKIENKIDIDDIQSASYILDMRSNKKFRFAKQIVNQPEKIFSNSALEKMYGENMPKCDEPAKKDLFSGIILKRCLEICKNCEKMKFDFQRRIEHEIPCSYPLFRGEHKQYMEKPSALRALVNLGFNSNLSEVSIEIAIECLRSIAAKIDGIEEIFSAFIEKTVREFDIRYLSEDAALALYYLMELARLVEIADPGSPVEEIGDLILEKNPPYEVFGEKSTCNADIVVKKFMGCIGNISKLGINKVISQNPSEIFILGEQFCFKLKQSDNGISLYNIINPFSVQNVL